MDILDLEQKVNLLLEDIKEIIEDKNDFEIVLKWNKVTNKAKLFQVLPNCRASATIWKLIREVEFNPVLQFVEGITDEITFKNVEIHSEVNSATKGKVIFNFNQI